MSGVNGSDSPSVIDAHVHVFKRGFLPDSLHQCTARSWAARTYPPRDAAELLPRLRSNEDPSAELMMRDMDDAGIDVAVTLALDPGLGFGDEQDVPAADIMAYYSKLQMETNGRILAFAGIDPRRADAPDILRWGIRDLDLRGVKLYPPHGYYMSDEPALALCRVAAEENVPVLVHTAVVAPPSLSWYCDPLRLAMVQREYPDLTLIIGHAGFDTWAREVARVAAFHDRTYLEISQWDSVARREPERCVRVLGMWRDLVGAHRILFGSDHISGPQLGGSRSKQAPWLQFIRELPTRGPDFGVAFSKEEVDLIIGGNARRILNLP